MEFIACANARPGELNFPSDGTRSVRISRAEVFTSLTGTKLLHVS
jgi:hypothetical protein